MVFGGGPLGSARVGDAAFYLPVIGCCVPGRRSCADINCYRSRLLAKSSDDGARRGAGGRSFQHGDL